MKKKNKTIEDAIKLFLPVLRGAEKAVGHRFADRRLLFESLSHSSFVNEHRNAGLRSNERLEFLGDSVINLIAAEKFLKDLPDADEGELSKKRAELVGGKFLAAVCRHIGLDEFLLLGKGETRRKGDLGGSLLADMFEAVVAAVYLDGGLAKAKRILGKRLVASRIEHDTPEQQAFDAKTALQERAQASFRERPSYEVVRTEGPPHDMTFTVETRVLGRLLGAGSGKSKKEAEQNAAAEALRALDKIKKPPA